MRRLTIALLALTAIGFTSCSKKKNSVIEVPVIVDTPIEDTVTRDLTFRGMEVIKDEHGLNYFWCIDGNLKLYNKKDSLIFEDKFFELCPVSDKSSGRIPYHLPVKLGYRVVIDIPLDFYQERYIDIGYYKSGYGYDNIFTLNSNVIYGSFYKDFIIDKKPLYN